MSRLHIARVIRQERMISAVQVARMQCRLVFLNGPVPDPGINDTGPRGVLLEFVIF